VRVSTNPFEVEARNNIIFHPSERQASTRSQASSIFVTPADDDLEVHVGQILARAEVGAVRFRR